MKKIDLAGAWELKILSSGETLEAIVPGSVMNDLMRHGRIEDPFYRDNEVQARNVSNDNYQYTRTFWVDRELLYCDQIILRSEGIDTIADVIFNGKLISKTNNMHQTHEWNIKSFIQEGMNTLTIILYSPVKYIQEMQSERPLWGIGEAMQGYPHIRKAHYMFGWDWGPQLPDLGIWRDIYITGWNTARLDNIYISQEHLESAVLIHVDSKMEKFKNKKVTSTVRVIDPDGLEIANIITPNANQDRTTVKIDDPRLWWPNGLGKQPLYSVEVSLHSDEMICDSKVYQIGLRTIQVKNEPDRWGKSFEFVINGISIFAKGANYIPEDNIIPRVSYQKTERLLQDCVEANFNMIRVWGGGYYPNNDFYDLCDRLGLIVWQDFMFACSVYELTEEFKRSIQKEVEDNVKRIRHHASLGIWCGNNEVESAWMDWGWPDDPKLKENYLILFEHIIANQMKVLDPKTFYWPSSPSSGGGFEDPNNFDSGDVHYWSVWHGQKPFTEFRKYHFRFCSEFGFQSFPSLKTIESFTLPEDRNIFSYVMETHQKNQSANGKIMYYLSDNLLYPKDFPSLLYASQILQAEAIKYGVEHWRRNLGRSMGALYWQINDCWPVASWSSIDSFGRWKALHYYAKKFFAPILLSISEEGSTAEIHITNETLQTISGQLQWALKKNTSEVIQKGITACSTDPMSTVLLQTLSFDQLNDSDRTRQTYLECKLFIRDKVVTAATVLFCKPKYFEFLNPQLTACVQEKNDRFLIVVSASGGFAKSVELDLQEYDARFSDNFFDLSAGDVKEIFVLKSNLNADISEKEFAGQLKIRSMYDISN